MTPTNQGGTGWGSDSDTGWGSSPAGGPQDYPGTSGPSGSYVYGQPAPVPARHKVSFSRTNPFQAPWNLLIAAVLYLAAVIYTGYLIVDQIINTTVRHDFFWEMIALKSLIPLATLVFIVVMLKAQPWGRYALTAVSVIGILVIVVNGLWPASLLVIGGVIALWLPAGHAWFGFRKG